MLDLPNQPTAPSFSLPGTERTTYGGDVVIKVVNGQLAICERIPLEDFLPGVLVKEMGGSWPLEALKAQAVAARSYIASQYLRRHDKDLAFGRRRTGRSRLCRIYRANRTLICKPHCVRPAVICWFTGGLPLTAWFHSCSGGRTADKNEAFPIAQSC